MRNIRTLTTAALGSIVLSLVATGCAADRNEDIPATAKIVAQGEKELTYRAPTDGRVYVFDKSGQNVLYSGKVDRDQVVKVEAMRDKITIDGATVMDKQIRDHDAINIFFEPEARREAAVIEAGDRTVIRQTEVRTEPRSDGSITVRPEGDRLTVDGAKDSKVTIEQPNTDSKVTIERSPSDR